MKKLIFLLAFVLLVPTTNASYTPEVFGFLDNKFYDIKGTLKYFCFANGECWGVDGKLAFTREPIKPVVAGAVTPTPSPIVNVMPTPAPVDTVKPEILGWNYAHLLKTPGKVGLSEKVFTEGKEIANQTSCLNKAFAVKTNEPVKAKLFLIQASEYSGFQDNEYQRRFEKYKTGFEMGSQILTKESINAKTVLNNEYSTYQEFCFENLPMDERINYFFSFEVTDKSDNTSKPIKQYSDNLYNWNTDWQLVWYGE